MGSNGEATVTSARLVGLEGRVMRVHVKLGGTAFRVLTWRGEDPPESAARELRVRVASALAVMAVRDVACAVTLDSAWGPGRDLPVAIAILVASGHVPATDALLVGELALDGRLRPARGVLAMLEAARDAGVTTAIVPDGNACEAAMVAGIRTVVAQTLGDVVAHLRGDGTLIDAHPGRTPAPQRWDVAPDHASIPGAMADVFASNNAILLVGPPGSGKTMLARALPGVLPPITDGERIEVARVQSACGLFQGIPDRPFRAPHHTVSEAGLVGARGRPGEVSLAHRGVLFLDEVTEFRLPCLEGVARAFLRKRVEHYELPAMPADFALVVAAHPCPCGYHGHPRKTCRCTPEQIRRHNGRLAPFGTMLTRIDVPAFDVRSLVGT